MCVLHHLAQPLAVLAPLLLLGFLLCYLPWVAQLHWLVVMQTSSISGSCAIPAVSLARIEYCVGRRKTSEHVAGVYSDFPYKAAGAVHG